MADTDARTSAAERKRRDLAYELLALHRKHADLFGAMDSLKASLIALATKSGDNFREVFERQGTVSVSGEKPEKFNGERPEIDADAWLRLSVPERKKLTASGLVKMVPDYTRAYHGRVTVKVF